MTPVLDQLLGNVLVVVIGLLIVYASKTFGTWYRPRYEREFYERPGERMGWDVLWVLLTRRAPILYVFVGPILGWFITGIGVVRLIDLAFKA